MTEIQIQMQTQIQTQTVTPIQIQIQTRYEAWEGENLSELSSSPKWWGYFLCGVRGVQEEVIIMMISIQPSDHMMMISILIIIHHDDDRLILNSHPHFEAFSRQKNQTFSQNICIQSQL